VRLWLLVLGVERRRCFWRMTCVQREGSRWWRVKMPRRCSEASVTVTLRYARSTLSSSTSATIDCLPCASRSSPPQSQQHCTPSTTPSRQHDFKMPAILDDILEGGPGDPIAQPTVLPFPPVTKQHILNCSYHSWHPRYRTITPKSRLIPLTQPFLEYLRADGIVLPDDDADAQPAWDSDSGVFSSSENPDAGEDEDRDVAERWRDLHTSIKRTIAELGGNVVPKLNWSAPKDATWMNANTMQCRSPNDIYLLLKSSDFVTHDLEHAFDDTIDSAEQSMQSIDIPYHLILRKTVPHFNPSVEFRCFVRNRKLLCIGQRDLNHYSFLFKMESKIQSLIQEFFDVRLRDTFDDDNFVFDVYIPAPYSRVWLVDINPWAPRTDPILFSWAEILNMPEPPDRGVDDDEPEGDEESVSAEGFVRLRIRSPEEVARMHAERSVPLDDDDDDDEDEDEDEDEGEDDEDDIEDIFLPELRLVRKSDPEAYSFATPQYSAHKMPKDVVDAGQSGEGLREFARDWENILARRRGEDAAAARDSGED
jgi:hypothetical protein